MANKSISTAILEQVIERKITMICLGKPDFHWFKILFSNNLLVDLLKKQEENNFDLLILN